MVMASRGIPRHQEPARTRAADLSLSTPCRRLFGMAKKPSRNSCARPRLNRPSTTFSCALGETTRPMCVGLALDADPEVARRGLGEVDVALGNNGEMSPRRVGLVVQRAVARGAGGAQGSDIIGCIGLFATTPLIAHHADRGRSHHEET